MEVKAIRDSYRKKVGLVVAAQTSPPQTLWDSNLHSLKERRWRYTPMSSLSKILLVNTRESSSSRLAPHLLSLSLSFLPSNEEQEQSIQEHTYGTRGRKREKLKDIEQEREGKGACGLRGRDYKRRERERKMLNKKKEKRCRRLR